MTVKHTLVSLDMRVFALCSLMKLHRGEKAGTRSPDVYSVRLVKRFDHLRDGIDGSPL